jgi:hypothetical protein
MPSNESSAAYTEERGRLTYAGFRAVQDAMTVAEWRRVEDKCWWENMIPWAVLNEWPSLRGSGARVLEAKMKEDPEGRPTACFRCTTPDECEANEKCAIGAAELAESAAATVPRLVVCGNCGQPLADHCTKHYDPCCPGHCTGTKRGLQSWRDRGPNWRR